MNPGMENPSDVTGIGESTQRNALQNISDVLTMESFGERATNQKQRRENVRQATRQANEEKNPCLHEQEISYRCLSDNDYDREKCSKSFLNYKNCMGFWTAIKKERRRDGIKPTLPPVEERESIRAAKLFTS